jgi:hypothetical protein
LLVEVIVQQQSHNPTPHTHAVESFASGHPDSSALRHRAGQLRRLATSIERSLVMMLVDVSDGDGWDTDRARLCDRMLDRNLHQLHQAADDLREAALACCHRADELDGGHRDRVA